MAHRQLFQATVALVALWGSACANTSDAGTTAKTCSPGQDLAGASYDLSKSRFAFGSSPVREDDSGLVRWVGSQGVVAIAPNGSAMAVPNGDSPALASPPLSLDAATIKAHTLAYFAAMGVTDCQVQDVSTSAGFAGTSVTSLVASLVRGIDSIAVSESQAWAAFTVDDQTTSESFFWPSISAAVVSAAVAFRNQLNDPQQLAVYKSRLPETARGEGSVAIHHSPPDSSSAIVKAIVTYDVLSGQSPLSFDASGTLVSMPFDP